MEGQIKRVSDVLPSSGDWGECLRMEDVRDKSFIILGYELYHTQKYGPAAKVYIDLDGQETAFLTFSQVIIDQLSRLEGHFPVFGTVTRKGRYWTLA